MKFNLQFSVEPSKEILGQWEVCCLELDIISYGDSPQHALAMGVEAASIVIIEDFKIGLDPFNRGKIKDGSII